MRLVKLFIAITAVLVAALTIAYHASPISTLDGIGGYVWPLGFPDTTVYSENYSHRAFRAVEAEMNEDDVLAFLGEPYEIWYRDPDFQRTYDRRAIQPSSDITYIWRYSHSPNDSHYRMRHVHIKDGIVVRRHSEYYVD